MGVAEDWKCLFNMLPPPHPPLTISHVVNGWASASVMKDRHSGEFTGPPLSSKLQHCSDVFVPAFCLTAGTSSRSLQLSCVLITDQEHPNEVPEWLDSIFPSLYSWEGKSYQSRNPPPLEQTYSTPTSPCCLEQTVANIYLPQFSHAKKQTKHCKADKGLWTAV